MNSSKQKLLSQIPPVDQILQHSELQPFIKKFSHDFVLQNVQIVTDQFRAELLAKKSSNNSSYLIPPRGTGMAGVAGFEPAHDGIKTRCLTTWLHPTDQASRAQLWAAITSVSNTGICSYLKVHLSKTSRTLMSSFTAVSRRGID